MLGFHEKVYEGVPPEADAEILEQAPGQTADGADDEATRAGGSVTIITLVAERLFASVTFTL
jgi:hypothetical protein